MSAPSGSDRRALLRPPLAAAACAVLAAALGLAVAWLDARLGPKQRLVPALAHLPALAAGGAVLTLVLLGLLLRRARAVRAARPRRFRVLYLLGVWTAQLARVAGALALLFLATFDLFGPSYLGVRAAAPDGTRTAYLYSQGLACGYTLYTRDRFGVVLTQRRSYTVDCKTRPTRPRLAWEGDRVKVLGEDGREVPSAPSPWDTLFRWH